MATSDIKKGPLYVDSTNNRVGVGTVSPDTTMHIHTSSAGTVGAVSGGVLTLEKNNHAVLQFLTPNDKKAIIYFGDPDDIDAGRLEYDHLSNAMSFNVNAAQRMKIDSSGRVTMPSQPSFLAYGSWSYDTNYFWKGFSAVDHNIGSHWNNTTGVWTCPVAGRYMIYATMYHDSSSNYHLWTFYKNSAAFAPWIQDYNQVSGEHTTSSTAIINCAANDTLQFNSNASYANAYTAGYNKVGVCLMG